MPEGPEIRRAADELANVLVNRQVRVEVTLPALQVDLARMSGHRIEAIDCHGKALLTRFSSGYTLYSHNQLYGVWRVTRQGQLTDTRRALRVAIHTDTHTASLYSATDISLWQDRELDQHPFLKKLGPDVLSPVLERDALIERLLSPAFRNKRLGNLYLDQHYIAGLGNYLRSEILFAARVMPSHKVSDLTAKDVDRLARQTLIISRRSYRTGGITLPSTIARDLQKTVKPFEARRFFVFARAGKSCYRCGARIIRETMTSRRIYSCTGCQS